MRLPLPATSAPAHLIDDLFSKTDHAFNAIMLAGYEMVIFGL
jgi:hypothetical protein